MRSISKQGVDHDLNSLTALMVTDCHFQSWTDLRVLTDPSFHFGCCVFSRKCVLSTWTTQLFKFHIVEGCEILSLRHGLRDTYIGAQFDQLMFWKMCEFLFVIVQQDSWHFVICPRRFVRCRQFCVTVVSWLFWATSFTVLSEQPEILQASSSHMSVTAPYLLSWLTEITVRRINSAM